MKEVRRKMAEAPKGIGTDEFKSCFEQWNKEVSIDVLHQMESALKVTGA